MGWFRSDDGLPEHAKADALVERCTPQQLAAAWMTWLHLGCDCRARGTDGAFTRTRALRAVRLPQAAVERALEDLTAVGLLDKAEEGWVFHGWLEYQPSAEEEDERREAIRRKRSEAGRRGNEVRWKGGSQTDRKRVANGSQTDRTGVAPSSQDDRKPIAPSQPIPSHPKSPPTPSPGVSAGEGGAPRLGAVERRGFRADELAALLRERARGRVLAAGADGRVLVQLQRAMDDAAREGATRASYETLADWYAAGSQSWRTRKPLGLAELATTPGTLAEHIEAAQRWHDEGRPAITHGDPKRRGPAPPSRFDGRDYEGDARRLAEAEAEAERAFNALPG